MIIDCLQYARPSETVFRQMRIGGVDAVHVTVAYHEGLRDMLANLAMWNGWFQAHPDLIFKGTTAADIDHARATGRTAIFFGFQNPSPIEDDLGMVEVCHQLGIRFMQLTYNNQSFLATGCYEADDTGLTRFGAEVVTEMNRVGLVIDMSHSGERSTREAIDASARPIAITHANPKWWLDVPRNHTDAVISAMTARGGMLGFSLYPHHLADGSACTLSSFCEMVAETASRHGADHLGIGSDLCQDQPDSVVQWMRDGRWTKGKSDAVFPPTPSWFADNRDFGGIAQGLSAVGFSDTEVAGLMGDNWYRFYQNSFGKAEGA